MKLNKYVVALTCTLAAAAHAETNFYVLGSAGVSRPSVNKSDINKLLESNTGTTVTSSSIDNTDVGYKLQAGYQLTKNFAVEGGYVDLGQAEIKSTTTGGEIKTDWEAKGWNLDAVAIIPVTGSFSVLAKFGVMQAKVEAKVHSSGASDSSNATHIAPIFGLGAAYAFNNNLSIRAEAESYSSVGNADKTGRADVYLLSAGVAYKF